ncbi:hypothetical protein ACA910_012410 [Epithemia clementina (nom. ined.)]
MLLLSLVFGSSILLLLGQHTLWIIGTGHPKQQQYQQQEPEQQQQSLLSPFHHYAQQHCPSNNNDNNQDNPQDEKAAADSSSLFHVTTPRKLPQQHQEQQQQQQQQRQQQQEAEPNVDVVLKRFPMEIVVQHDKYVQDISWNLTNVVTGKVVVSRTFDSSSTTTPGETTRLVTPVAAGTYTFGMTDSYGGTCYCICL